MQLESSTSSCFAELTAIACGSLWVPVGPWGTPWGTLWGTLYITFYGRVSVRQVLPLGRR